MSIATEIEALQTNLASAKTAVQTKGGTVGDTGLAGLADEIATIPTGGGFGIPRVIDNNGVISVPDEPPYTLTLPSEVKGLGYNAMRQAFYNASGLTNADLSGITSVTGVYALQECFRGCSNLVSIDLSNLERITEPLSFQSTFRACTSLTSVTFTKLSDISINNIFQQCFYGCTSLQSVSFPALTSSSFGTYTNQFDSMLTACSGVTVHFPASIQSTIGSWTSVTNGFSGTNTTVLFDL